MDAPKLICYVVDHDTGYAPNPFFRKCILSHCKYSKTGKRRNVIELAEKGTWVVGTGGGKLQKYGKLIYAMKVEEKLPISEFFRRREFALRRKAFEYKTGTCGGAKGHGEWMLVAKEFYYFGQDAVDIPHFLKRFQKDRSAEESLEKRGPGYRSRFSDEFVQRFEKWIRSQTKGCNGLPHALWLEARQVLEKCGEL